MQAEIKLSIQKLENEKNKKTKVINDYSQLIQTIKKRISIVCKKNRKLKDQITKS